MTRLLIAPLVLAIVACTGSAPSPSPSPSPSPASLDGRTFVSSTVTRDGAPFPLAPGSQLRVTFNFGNLGASAGCNQMSATYLVDGNVLRISGLGMTEMACAGPGLMEQEQWFAQILGGSPLLALDGDTLTMTLDNSSIEFTDAGAGQPAAQLVGPLWRVVSIIDGESVSSLPQGADATFQFAADGGVTLNTGCNSGGGRYAVDGGTLSFADIVTTKRACGGAGGQLENVIIPLVNAGALTFTIDGQVMTLTADGRGVQLSAA